MSKAFAMRKPLMAIVIVACLIMTVVGRLVPILQGWIFFVIALYLLATSSIAASGGSRPPDSTGHSLIAGSSGRATDRWAPRHVKEFEGLTDPKR